MTRLVFPVGGLEKGALRVLSLLALSSALFATPIVAQIADLVLHNGRIVTVDDRMPEGTAMAVIGDRVFAVGSDEEIRQYIGDDTNVIDLDGQLAIPGFIESHGHFLGVGDAQMQLQLMPTKTWDEIVSLVEAAVTDAGPGELIRGRGWHQEKWDPKPARLVEGLPTHHLLSAVSPDNPVVLRHASGHATFANAKAMEMAGITRDTENPPGGEIVRDDKSDKGDDESPRHPGAHGIKVGSLHGSLRYRVLTKKTSNNKAAKAASIDILAAYRLSRKVRSPVSRCSSAPISS